VAFDNFPLFVRGATRLVQKLRRNGKFANIVEHCAPTQTAPVFLGYSHFFGDNVGKRTDPFGVAAGSTIVTIEFVDQMQNLLGSFLGIIRKPVLAELCSDSLSVCC
jgi:hypothetical protein